MQNINDKLEQLVTQAKEDENILGFILTASRGKGMVTELSDYDCAMIVKDEFVSQYRKEFNNYGLPDIELQVFSESEFGNYAGFGSSEAWNRYNFAHLEMLVDKTGGKLQQMVDEKGIIPSEKINEVVTFSLEAYVNLVYRSLKNNRDRNTVGARLDAVESIPYLLTAIFAIEGCERPYNKYLVWEFKNHPLKKIPWDTEKFINYLMSILENGDVEAQKQLLRDSESLFRQAGYGSVFDSWGEKLNWMKKNV